MNKRIKELRIFLKMNQEEFGKLLGITKSGVSDIESGRRNVTEQHIIMLKNQNVNETWLREGIGEKIMEQTRDEQIEEFIGDLLKNEDDSFKHRLISGLAALDDTGWKVLENFLESIRKKED